jgi:hypothetical protein
MGRELAADRRSEVRTAPEGARTPARVLRASREEDKMDHDLKDFFKLHSRDGAATGSLCARPLKRIEVLGAALTPFALFSQRAKGDDEAVLRRSDFEHARVVLTGDLSGE